jgi:hypothetical protein
MAYVTPVTDRSASDIAARNSKAFWNVSDFTRVYGNSQLVNSLAAIMLDTGIQFDVLTTPAITTIPNVTDFNTFLANIERVRLAVGVFAIPGALIAIKYNWEAGTDKLSPTYSHANLWESTLDAIWEFYGGPDLDVCPTLTADLTITTGNQEIYVDCLDANGFNITIQDGATLAIIP